MMQLRHYACMSVVAFMIISFLPSAFADPPVDVIENRMVSLVGDAADPDNDNLSFKWIQTDGDHVVLSSTNEVVTKFMAPEVENGSVKVLEFMFTVTDSFGASDSDSVIVVVHPVNHDPIANAGPDKAVFESLDAVSLVGHGNDPDGDAISYSWKQLSGQKVEIDDLSKHYISFIPNTLDFTQMDSLVFQLTVTDEFGGSSTDTAKVNLFDATLSSEAISVKTGPIQTVEEGKKVTLDVTGKTSTGQPIQYTWIQLTGIDVTLDARTTPNPTFIAPELDDQNSVILSFHVTGYSPGLGWANGIALVKVVPTNGPPVVDAGEDIHANVNQHVKLNGSGVDPDGDQLRFSWTQISGTPVEIYDSTQAFAYIITPNRAQDNEFVFELVGRDNFGNEGTDTKKVTMTFVNSPPNANAGPDLKVYGDTKVIVNGKGFDINGDELTYKWTQVSGDSVTFENNNPSFSFTTPAIQPGEQKRMTFQLQVSDTFNQSDFDEMNLIVIAPQNPPIANAGPDRIGDENSMISLECTGHDPDGDTITYKWTSSDPNISFDNMNKPNPSVLLPTVAVDEKFVLTCTVSDGNTSVSDSMVITVQNVLSRDIIADAGFDQVVNEQVQVLLDGSNSNDPERQPISFEWTQISGESVALSSDNSVRPSFVSPVVANGEIKVLEFELKVFDTNGRSAIDSVIVTVDPVNSSPGATATAIQE